MTDLVIACLSQKGGVGKSTIARLIARTYAAGGWNAKIADFNINQLTSGDWVDIRRRNGIEPVIDCEPYHSAKSFHRDKADVLIADGKPDSDQSSMEIAKAATAIIVPTGHSHDDLKPQARFVLELLQKGIPHERILMVLNKLTDSKAAVEGARAFLTDTGLRVATIDIPAKATYEQAQNDGRALSECQYKPLAERADELGAEIVAFINSLEQVAA